MHDSRIGSRAKTPPGRQRSVGREIRHSWHGEGGGKTSDQAEV